MNKTAYLDRLKDTTIQDYQTKAPIIAVRFGDAGFWPIWSSATADELNAGRGINKEAAYVGSMLGWGCPGAKDAFGEPPHLT